MPKLTIIVPGDPDRMPEESRRCLQRQTMKDMEIRYISSGEGVSLGKVLNDAVQGRIEPDAVQGEYVGFFLPGDEADLDMYEKLYQVLSVVDERVAYCYSDYYIVEENEENGDRKLLYQDITGKRFSAFHALFRRDFLRKYNVRFYEKAGDEFADAQFCHLAWAYCELGAHLKQPLYRRRPGKEKPVLAKREDRYRKYEEYSCLRNVLLKEKKREGLEIFWRERFHVMLEEESRVPQKDLEEYISFYSRLFRRAEQLSELLPEHFTQEEWNCLQLLIRDPDGYYYQLLYSGTKGYERSRRTAAYHLGNLLVGTPRKILKVMKVK